MTHGMNDDFGFRGLIKNLIGIRQRRQAPDHWIIRAGTDMGMQQEKGDDGLNTSVNVLGIPAVNVRRYTR
jgi:hypothetical protein